MLEDPRALVCFFVTFFAMILISTSLFRIKIGYTKITIFSIVLSLFDYLAKYLAFKTGQSLIWHIALSLFLLAFLIYKFNKVNLFTSLAVSLISYILLFLSESLISYPCLYTLQYITGLQEKVFLNNQLWFNIWGLFTHMPLYIAAIIFYLKKSHTKEEPING